MSSFLLLNTFSTHVTSSLREIPSAVNICSGFLCPSEVLSTWMNGKTYFWSHPNKWKGPRSGFEEHCNDLLQPNIQRNASSLSQDLESILQSPVSFAAWCWGSNPGPWECYTPSPASHVSNQNRSVISHELVTNFCVLPTRDSWEKIFLSWSNHTTLTLPFPKWNDLWLTMCMCLC